MYKSPIEIIHGQLETQLEGEVLKAVQKCGVDVDKDELIRALNDDRQQYEQGYKDAMERMRWIPVSERLPKNDGRYLVVKLLFDETQWPDVLSFAKDGEQIDEYDLSCKTDVWYFYDSEYGYVSTDSVTHWMPLPEMPELPKGE